MTSKEKFEAMKRIVEFARANGFPKANLYFMENESEYGHSDIEYITENYDRGNDVEIHMHIDNLATIHVVAGGWDKQTGKECADTFADTGEPVPVREGGE